MPSAETPSHAEPTGTGGPEGVLVTVALAVAVAVREVSAVAVAELSAVAVGVAVGAEGVTVGEDGVDVGDGGGVWVAVAVASAG